MDIVRTERGMTLLETVVAAGLLVTLATGTASLILLAHQLGARAEQLITATALASTRLAALCAIPWEYDIDGSAPDVPALALAPPDVLDRNVEPYWDAVDEAGRAAGTPSAEGPAFVRRWAVRPIPVGSGEARALEVCVFPSMAADGPPITCLASVRTRQP